jgi:hypothetical protein
VWGYGGKAPPFLTSAVGGGEWSASRPCYFTAGEIAHGTQIIEGWVGPRAGLNAVECSKISFPCSELNRGRPTRSLSLSRLLFSSRTWRNESRWSMVFKLALARVRDVL